VFIGPGYGSVGVNFMSGKAPRVVLVWCAALSLGQARSLPQAQAPEKGPHRPISFFIYADSSIAEHGDGAVRAQFQEFVDHLGNRSRYGSLGIALNYPYLTYVTGRGPASFAIDAVEMKRYEANVRVAHEMGLPVVVGFNDGPWFSPGGSFYAYWKTTDGGGFLARYKDGEVNESLRSKGSLTKEELEPFLGINLYDVKRSQDALLLTLSPYATRYRRARLRVLGLALAEWQRIDRTYPGTIQAFTTDSEVCDFSFRSVPSGDALPVGYEKSMTEPFCRRYGIADCGAFFRNRQFTYQSPEERHWFDFRADAHRQFVSDTVFAIRRRFPSTVIYTHQLGTLDEKLVLDYRRQDFASPQRTAFVDGSIPGVTANVYFGRDADFRELVSQISEKAGGRGWALAEFNPGKNWPGSRVELSLFSFDLLRFLADHNVSIITLLAWQSNELDAGIKDSGVDDAVKRFLAEGPDAGNAR